MMMLSLENGGRGASAYADALAAYLAIAVDKGADYWSYYMFMAYMEEIRMRNTFARQAISMVWDFAEANPMSASTGNFNGAIDWVAEVVNDVVL